MTTLPAQPAAIDTAERTDARALTLPLVGAQVAQNVAGGLLLGNAVAAVMWLAGVDLATWWRVPVGVGWLIAGLGGLRAFADEWRADRRWNAREREHAEEMAILSEDYEELEQERDALKALYEREHHERLRLENELSALKYLGKAATATPRSKPVQDLFSPAQRDDARHLITVWYQTGRWPGERSMGWPRARHSAARDILRRAGVATDANTSHASSPPESEAWALAKLAAWFGSTASTASDTSSPRRGVDAVDAEAGE